MPEYQTEITYGQAFAGCVLGLLGLVLLLFAAGLVFGGK